MGIFTRFRDIISSNINAMLDKAEDPEKLIKLMIREMEDTLIEIKASCAGVMANRKKVERQLNEIRSRERDWKEKAEIAVNKGRDDLAREALVEKRRFGDRLRALELEFVEYVTFPAPGRTFSVFLQILSAQRGASPPLQKLHSILIRTPSVPFCHLLCHFIRELYTMIFRELLDHPCLFFLRRIFESQDVEGSPDAAVALHRLNSFLALPSGSADDIEPCATAFKNLYQIFKPVLR